MVQPAGTVTVSDKIPFVNADQDGNAVTWYLNPVFTWPSSSLYNDVDGRPQLQIHAMVKTASYPSGTPPQLNFSYIADGGQSLGISHKASDSFTDTDYDWQALNTVINVPEDVSKTFEVEEYEAGTYNVGAASNELLLACGDTWLLAPGNDINTTTTEHYIMSAALEFQFENAYAGNDYDEIGSDGVYIPYGKNKPIDAWMMKRQLSENQNITQYKSVPYFSVMF